MLRKTLFLSLLLAAGLCAMQAPEPVPRKTKRTLDKTSYLQLAGQWKKYIEQSGPSAPAWTNLALAYRYSDQTEAARISAEKALALDPDYPPALDELGNLLSQNSSTMPRALELLEHCRAVAPDYEEGLNMLAVIYLKSGELDKADDVFRDIYNQNLIERPLMDYGYNMLVGLPQGAVLFTNGDNDTFPPLVLQAGMGFHTDVAVLNRHLIKVDAYRNAVFKRYPKIYSGLKERIPFAEDDSIMRTIIGQAVVPVFLAKTMNRPDKLDLQSDGLNDRVIKAGEKTPPDQSVRLFLEVYRLDSATDWSFPWDLYPALREMTANYVLSMLESVKQNAYDLSVRQKILDRAMAIAKFHGNKDAVREIKMQSCW